MWIKNDRLLQLIASQFDESLVEKGAEELILTFLYISPDEVKVLSALKFRADLW